MLAMKLATRSALIALLVLYSGLLAQAEDAIRWRKDLEEAKQEAAQTGRLVLLHFYGSSCAPCARLDKEVFSQKQTAAALEASYVPLKINVDHSMAIASAYNVTNWPNDVVITPTGHVIAKFVSPQGLQPYLTRMDQVAIAARDQAAAGLVKMGPNGANPYSNIAVPATGTADGATLTAVPNDHYAAPTQYQESVPRDVNVGNPQAGAPYAAQRGTAYSPGPSQDPYNNGNPYGSANNQAGAPPAQSVDRYSNAAVGDRYATPQYGAYDPTAAREQYTPETEGNYFDNRRNAAAALGDATGYRAAGGGYGASNGAPGAAPTTQTQPVVGTPYAPPVEPQMQQNPYAAPPQNRYASEEVSNPAAPTGYDPNRRYDADPRYGAAQPPAYNASQQTAAGAAHAPDTDYSQAPSMNKGLSATVAPGLGAPAGTSPSASTGPAPNGQGSAQPISGNPAFGLDGFCPVALAEKQSWIQGDKAWGAIHLGKTYLFVSQEYQQKFLANPDAYAPVLAGNDPVLAIDQNRQTPGSRSHGVFYRDHVYLFSGEASLDIFRKDAERYANGVHQAMLQRRPGGEQRR
jgi:YHS domain-containing protein